VSIYTDVARDYKKRDESTYTLAKRYGVSPTTIARWIRRQGGTVRTASEGMRWRLRALTDLQESKVYEHRNHYGWSLRRIAEKFKVSLGTIRNVLIRHEKTAKKTVKKNARKRR